MNLSYDKKGVGNIFFGVLIVLGLLSLIYLIRPILTALSITLVLSYLLYPVLEKFESYLESRWLSVGLTVLFIMIPLFIFLMEFASTVLSQLIALSKTTQFKELVQMLGENLREHIQIPSESEIADFDVSTLMSFSGIFSGGISRVVTFFRALGGLFTQVLLGIFLTVYVLFKKDSINDLRNSVDDSRIREFLNFIDDGLKQVVYSMIFTAAVTGVLAVIIFNLFRIPFATLWGATTGVVALIPLLGNWLVYLPITIYLLIGGEVYFAVTFFITCLFFITILPDIAVRPFTASKKVDVGLLVIGFLTGGLTLGATGVIIGPLIIIAWTGFFKIFLMSKQDEKDY